KSIEFIEDHIQLGDDLGSPGPLKSHAGFPESTFKVGFCIPSRTETTHRSFVEVCGRGGEVRCGVKVQRMATSFDLAERGFCPVRWRAGQRPETFSPEASLGLVDLLLHAHRIEDVEISPPPALSGFLRILAVLTGRITGLDRMESFEDWEEAREDLLHTGRFDETAIRRY